MLSDVSQLHSLRLCYYLWLQNLESLSFGFNGDEFISAHIDGSYTVWSLSDAARPKVEPVTPYGLSLLIFLHLCIFLCACVCVFMRIMCCL